MLSRKKRISVCHISMRLKVDCNVRKATKCTFGDFSESILKKNYHEHDAIVQTAKYSLHSFNSQKVVKDFSNQMNIAFTLSQMQNRNTEHHSYHQFFVLYWNFTPFTRVLNFVESRFGL